jgi:hypothetical protein
LNHFNEVKGGLEALARDRSEATCFRQGFFHEKVDIQVVYYENPSKHLILQVQSAQVLLFIGI